MPGAIARAFHEAVTGRGPALVIVPMDDWSADAGPAGERAAPRRVSRARAADGAVVAELAELLAGASSPALVVGAGADDPETWKALVGLAERLGCPVWQESFSARAGFPQDHALFAGHLPADRTRLRQTLAPYDVVLAVGAPTFRQYPFIPGPFVESGTRVAMVSDDPAEVHRSSADLALLAAPGPVCAELARRLPARSGSLPTITALPAPPAPPATGEPLRAGHVFAAIADRLPRNAIVIEESPSSRPELLARLPARESLGIAEPRDGRARVRPARGHRAAHGTPGQAHRRDRRRRLVAVLRSSRCGARRSTGPARSS